MSELTRTILGQRNNEVGFWLSAPGKDATTAQDDDLLISSNQKNVAFLIKARVSLGTSSPSSPNPNSKIVNFERLDAPPLVWPQIVSGGVILLPSLQRGTSLGHKSVGTPRFEMDVERDRFIVRRVRIIEFTVQYMILNTPLI